MAEKPTRKAPARKGPTKASALKALGLTQEDLDNIQALKNLRRAHADAEADAKLAAETGAPPQAIETPRTGEAEEVSEDRQLMNIGWSAAAAQGPDRPEPVTNPVPAEPVFYARNRRGVEVRFRLTRQSGQGTKSTKLNPRGQRGDMFRLEPGDLQDTELRTQVAYDLIEIIPEGEALGAINKQAINASQPGARAIEQMLTNEKGDKMLTEQNQSVVHADTIPFEQQGVTVARLNPQQNSPTGELPTAGKGIDWAAARNTDPVGKGVGSGPIVQDASPEALAAAKDAIARRNDLQGPKAGLGNVKVTVAPTEKN